MSVQRSSAGGVEALTATAAIGEAARSAWCRAHGPYSQQLAKWHENAAQTPAEPEEARAAPQHTRGNRGGIKELERGVRRNNRALAWAAASLVLSGKLEAVFENDIEQGTTRDVAERGQEAAAHRLSAYRQGRVPRHVDSRAQRNGCRDRRRARGQTVLGCEIELGRWPYPPRRDELTFGKPTAAEFLPGFFDVISIKLALVFGSPTSPKASASLRLRRTQLPKMEGQREILRSSIILMVQHFVGVGCTCREYL